MPAPCFQLLKGFLDRCGDGAVADVSAEYVVIDQGRASSAGWSEWGDAFGIGFGPHQTEVEAQPFFVDAEFIVGVIQAALRASGARPQ